MFPFIIELLVIGIATAIIGLLVMSVVPQPTTNQMLNVAIALFITGVLIHLISEVSGVNAWYCKNGNACLQK